MAVIAKRLDLLSVHASAPGWRRFAAWAALLAILLLPVLHAIHLATDDDGDNATVAQVAITAGHSPAAPLPVHDEDRCAVCFTFHAIFATQALLAITFAFLFCAPPVRRIVRYAPPLIDRAARPRVAIPRGPPALA